MSLGFFLTGVEDKRTPLEIALMENDTKFLEAYYAEEDKGYESLKKDSLWDILKYITSNSEKVPDLDSYDNFTITMFLSRNPKNRDLCHYLNLHCGDLDKRMHMMICKTLSDKSFYKYYYDELSEKFKIDIKDNAYIELLKLSNRTNLRTSRRNLTELKVTKRLNEFLNRMKRTYPFSVIEEFIMESDHKNANKKLLLDEIRRIFGEL